MCSVIGTSKVLREAPGPGDEYAPCTVTVYRNSTFFDMDKESNVSGKEEWTEECFSVAEEMVSRDTDNDGNDAGGEDGEVQRGEPGTYMMHYKVEDVPAPHLSFAFGLQQVMLSIGSTIAVPLIVANEICAGDLDLVKSEIMSTFLFMCGVCTILQIAVGVRLPIIQGGCHKFIPAVIAMMTLPEWRCPNTSAVHTAAGNTSGLEMTETLVPRFSDDERTEIWQIRMREIQGGIIMSALVQVFIGSTGIIGFILQYIGPITIVPTITLVGLSLIDVALRFCKVHWGIAALTVCLVLLFSLYINEVKIPFPAYSKWRKCHIIKYPVFKHLPVMLAVIISWSVCAILTATGQLSSDPKSQEYFTRTDARIGVIASAKWFYIPYPGQWGMPTVSVASYMAMMAATMASIIESVGDYYACARISCVAPPPAHAVNRGVAIEGFGSVLSGIMGSGGATTSYSQNVGAIGYTKVASRRAFQVAGLIFVICGLCGKLGALLTLLPDPVLGGIVLVSFGMVTSVGLTNLQFVSLKSSRNLVIIGCSLIVGLIVPRYVTANPGCINTGNGELDRVLTVLFSTAMFVGGLIGFVLDNTVAGSEDERGIKSWRDISTTDADDYTASGDTTYDLPYIMGFLRQHNWTRFVPFLPTFRFNIGTSLKRCYALCRQRC